MKTNILFLVLIILVSSSCRRSGVNEYELLNVKRKIITEHNHDAYLELLETKLEFYEENLPYHLIMSKDSTDGLACFSFYQDYLRIANSGKFDKNTIIKLDKPEQDYLIYMLNKGALKEDEYCRTYLYYYYKNGIGVKKDSLKADSISKFYPKTDFDIMCKDI